MSGDATLQLYNVLVGNEPQREVRLWRDLRKKLPGTFTQRQRGVRAKLSAKEKGANRNRFADSVRLRELKIIFSAGRKR